MRTFGLALMVMALSTAAGAHPFARPAVVRMGASTAELQRALAPQCTRMTTRKIDPPFLPDVRNEQLQIDCEGFKFRGAGRHVEFVIRDNRLVMVWLMVEPAEEAAIVSDMKAALGTPTGENAKYIAFERDRTAWRHEPAEILFYAPELDKDMAPDFR